MTNNIDDYLNDRAGRVSSEKIEILPELCTLELVIPSLQIEPIPLICELSFGIIEEALLGETWQIGITAARLKIRPTGYNVNKEGRFGSSENLNKVSVEKNLSVSESDGKKGTVSASPGSGLTVAVSADTAKSLGSTYSVSQDHHYVAAQASDSWYICGPDGFDQPLSGRLIPGIELCYLTPVGQTNRKSLQGVLEIAPSSVKFVKLGNSKKKLKQHALIQTLVSKRLRETGRKYIIFDKNTPNFVVTDYRIEDNEDL